MSGPTPVNTSGDNMCLAWVGTGTAAIICRRPEGHKPLEEDGIGHSATAFPTRANFVDTALQMRQELARAWDLGKASKPEDTNPYK